MKKVSIRCTCIALFVFLLAPAAFAASEYVDDWVGTWKVTMNDNTKQTWEITDTWVSPTGMSHIAYGVRTPGDVEFQIYYATFFEKYEYIEASHETTVYELPSDLSQYTQLVPNDDFTSFTTVAGAYAIKSGKKGGGSPCVAEYVLGADAPGLAKLRNFRDNRLAASAAGKKLIKLYYAASDSMIAACGKSPAAKRSLQLLLQSVIAVMP